MTNPGFSLASADPADHPELTFVASPSMHLPPGCPPPDPGQIVEPSVTVAPGDDQDATAPPNGGLVVIAHDDLPEPVFVDPQGS